MFRARLARAGKTASAAINSGFISILISVAARKRAERKRNFRTCADMSGAIRASSPNLPQSGRIAVRIPLGRVGFKKSVRNRPLSGSERYGKNGLLCVIHKKLGKRRACFILHARLQRKNISHVPARAQSGRVCHHDSRRARINSRSGRK